MGIFSKIVQGLANIRKENEPALVNKPISGETLTKSIGYSEDLSKRTQAEFLASIKGWTYSCISAISDQIASIDLKLYKLNADGSSEEIVESPILDVLYKVNNFTTRFDHFWITQAFLESVGEAFWYLEKENGVVTNIYFLQPDKIEPVVNKERMVEGYYYMLNNGRTFLQVDQVIFLKMPNPANPWRGLGTMEAASTTIDLDNYAEEWNKNFFKNSARPHSILKVKNGNMSKEQMEKLKDSIKRSYQGLDKAHGTMVLFGDMDVTPFGTAPKDMDYVRQQEFARDKILGIFRVPKAVVAQTESSGFAAAKTAQYAFAKWTIEPKMERLIQQLNEFFIPQFANSEGLYLDYDNPIPEDENYQLNLINSGITNGWMTVNEVRAMQNLSSIEGGDELRANNPVSPLGLTYSKPKSVKAKVNRVKEIKSRSSIYFKAEKVKNVIKEKIKDQLRKDLMGKITKKEAEIPVEINKPKVWGVENKMDFWQIKSAIYDNNVLKTFKKQAQIFRDQKKEVLAKLNSEFPKEKALDVNKLIALLLLDKKLEAKKYKKAMEALFNDIFKESTDATHDFLHDHDGIDVDTSNITAEKYIKKATTKVSNSITDTTNSIIRDRLSEGIAKGESNQKLADRISNLFGEAEESRALSIARTETARYSEQATLDVYRESGVVEGKEWVNNPEACEFCQEMEGMTVGLDDDFASKNEGIEGVDGGEIVNSWDSLSTPPLHPNCRCYMAPVFK